MPCDSISTVDIDAGKMDAQHVKRALEAMGLHPRHHRPNIYDHDQGNYNHATGQAQWYVSRYGRQQAAEDRTAELKRAYAAEVVKSQAARFGWTLRQSATDKYAFTVAKR